MANTFEFNLDLTTNECRKLIKNNGYGIEIVLAKKLTTDDILTSLRTDTFIRNANDTLKLIKDSCSGVDEIQCEALKVPLTCVVSFYLFLFLNFVLFTNFFFKQIFLNSHHHY